MKKHYIVVLFLFISCISGTFGQSRDERMRTKGYVNPQEIVSLDSTMRMDQALLVIGELSKQFAGKIIIDLEKRTNPIGVYIVNQHWRDALEIILSRNGLTYTEEADYIRITPAGATPTTTGGPIGSSISLEPPPTLDAKDVKISAAFFSTNLDKLQSYGISWDFFRSKSKEPAMNFYNSAGITKGDTTSPIPPQSISPSFDKALGIISSPPEFTFANIDALVKFFGSNQLGEVITSPELIVRNGKEGYIQIGKSIFIVTRDVAGNSVNTQVQTGTIIKVTPTVFTQADTSFIYLQVRVEQSEAAVGVVGPEIDKTLVETHALLYDGEETVIGGLYTTSDQETREGVPVLKDLPWWFFGLRYVFGSENTEKIKTELIILLKAELSQPIRGRMVNRFSQQELIDAKRKDLKKEYEKK